MSTKKTQSDYRSQPLMSVQARQWAQIRRSFVAQMPIWRRPFTGYLFSIPFFVLISLGILWVQHLFPHFYFFEGPLLLAVMVIALIWGVGPALFSALISTAALAYFYIPAFQSINFTTWDDVLPIVPLFFSGMILAVITGQRESARRRAYFAEQEEQERASELEATFEAMADGVIVYDDTGHILRTNAAARRLFALDTKPKAKFSLRLRREQRPELVILDEQGQILPEEQSPLSRILNGEVLTSSNAMDVILRMQSGDEVQLNVAGAPVYSFGGYPIGAICVFRDVTERRQLERRTHDALNALVAMAETLVQVPEVIGSTKEHWSTETSSSTDAEEHKSTTNEVAQHLARLTCSILGCRRVGIIAVDPETDLLHPVEVVGLSLEEENQWWTSYQQPTRLSDSPYPELVARLRSNEALVLDLTEPPFRDQPNPYNMHIVLVAPMFVGNQLVGMLGLDYGGADHDYSAEEIALARATAKLAALVIERERLLYERAKARANELALREANRRMDEFLGMASHELRTPLTTLRSQAQKALYHLAKLSAASSDLTIVRTATEKIDEQTRRLKSLVDNLLDLSGNLAGKKTLRLRNCDLVAICLDVVEDRRFLTGHIIEIDIPSTPVMLQADGDRLGHVIVNLLDNAIKYSPEGYPVRLSVRELDNMAIIQVSDAGPGIPKEEHEHIFERFYHSQIVPEPSKEGLRLGLAICKDIVERHHGSIKYDFSAREGSTFVVELPLIQEKAPSTA